MSVSHCMNRTLDIARMPEADWPAQIAALPDTCAHADCGAPRSCRERAAEYLRMQWRVRRALEAKGKTRG
jgi:hypothetical protein